MRNRNGVFTRVERPAVSKGFTLVELPAVSKAFTLVELLVVIGIIAVLISILLPALGKAREHSRSVACASNQKQVMNAILMYVNDNKGIFPPHGPILDPINYPSYGWGWFTRPIVGQYLGEKSDAVAFYTTRTIYFCPATTFTYASAGAPLYGSNFGIGYNCHPNARLWKSDQAGRGQAKLGTMNEPTKVLVLADVGAGNTTGACRWVQYYNGSGTALSGTYTTQPSLEAISYRHGRRGNVAFADGHVETFSAKSRDDNQLNTHKNEGLDMAITNKDVRYIAR